MLHIDGDEGYLAKCSAMYQELKVPVSGYYCPEPQMAAEVEGLLKKEQPDILVLTGHDGMIKRHRKTSDQENGKDGEEEAFWSLENYRHSRDYVRAVQRARQYERNRDALIIIAGACQSHFEALLKAGANIASSPRRVLIHTYDPVIAAQEVAYTSLSKTVDIGSLVRRTITGMGGMGGIETRGLYRLGFPVPE